MILMGAACVLNAELRVCQTLQVRIYDLCVFLQGSPNITAFEVCEETNPAPGTPSFDA